VAAIDDRPLAQEEQRPWRSGDVGSVLANDAAGVLLEHHPGDDCRSLQDPRRKPPGLAATGLQEIRPAWALLRARATR